MHTKAQVVHTQAKTYIPTFVSSQNLAYRSPAGLGHKINFTRAEVSNTKPLIIIIPMVKYIITVINTGRQIHWHQVQMGNNLKVLKASRTGILLFSSMRDLVLANKYHVWALTSWVKFGHGGTKILVRLINKDDEMNLHELHRKRAVTFQAGIQLYLQCSLVQLSKCILALAPALKTSL